MNEKAKSLLKNINYTVSANFLVLGISIILNLFVPKFLGVKEYSFWQLYVFYSSYVGFFHFGWLDGIYLKIGGEEYENLPKKILGTQFWYLLFFQLILALGLISYVLLSGIKGQRALILLCVSIILIITNCKTFILYILQSTNRIREYALLSQNDRYLYLLGVIVYLFFGGRNFFFLITIDILSKLLMTVWGARWIKDILVGKFEPFTRTVKIIVENISIGINLMISNIASMLVMGVTRIFVEKQWGIETFGQLSFTLNISSMFMTFINAVGVVMFPLLRRTDRYRLKKLYLNLRHSFVPITYGLLLTFVPIKLVLSYWLPDYAQSVNFMGTLFPMIIYEGRMSLLVSTYLKTIRKEKSILIANILTLAMTLVVSSFTVFYLKNISLTVVGIIFCIAFRCVFAELLLSKILNIQIVSELLIETILTVIFVMGNLLLNRFTSFCVYCVSYFIYLVIVRKKTTASVKELLSLMK
ncbi:hypothetical protein IGI65_001076 [Enterococcus sp. DIV0755b]|uniref:lipopolysaccharide biosynthesis protein n=1 Tax=Enterococcus sp. DIV0755b TaxID=2774657 RepID=UPI003F271893